MTSASSAPPPTTGPAASGPPASGRVHRLPLAARSDVALVEGALRGEASAQGLIWDRYAAQLRRVLQRSLGPGCDVDDALQETFITLFNKLASLRDPHALQPFLIGIAMRMARAQLRKRQRRRWLRGVFGRAQEAQPAADHDAREALARLYAALDELDPQTRLAFVLRYIEGLSLPEVAEALNTSLATIKRKLQRARGLLESRAARDPVLSSYGAMVQSRQGERARRANAAEPA